MNNADIIPSADALLKRLENMGEMFMLSTIRKVVDSEAARLRWHDLRNDKPDRYGWYYVVCVNDTEYSTCIERFEKGRGFDKRLNVAYWMPIPIPKEPSAKKVAEWIEKGKENGKEQCFNEVDK